MRRRLLVVEVPADWSDKLDAALPREIYLEIHAPGLNTGISARLATRAELAALGMIGFADFLAGRLGGP